MAVPHNDGLSVGVGIIHYDSYFPYGPLINILGVEEPALMRQTYFCVTFNGISSSFQWTVIPGTSPCNVASVSARPISPLGIILFI